MAARPRRIMVGYDGSEAATRALDVASELVGYGSTLTVVTVHNDAPNRATAAAREHLQRRQVEARYHEAHGDPAEQLVEKANELGADLVVVGRRSRSPLGELLGSVSSKVLRRARCDVLVVQ